MMVNFIDIFIYAVIGIIILLLIIPLLSGGIGGGGGGILKESKLIKCDVTLKNQLLQQVKIENIACSSSITRACLPISVSTQILGYTDKGTIFLIAGSKQKSQSYSIDEGKTSLYSLSVCAPVDTSTVTIRALNEENEILEGSKEVSV